MKSRNPEKILIDQVRELKRASVLNTKSREMIEKETRQAMKLWINQRGLKPELVVELLEDLLELKLKEGLFKKVEFNALLCGALPADVKKTFETKLTPLDIFLIEELAQQSDLSGQTHFYLQPTTPSEPNTQNVNNTPMAAMPGYASTAMMMTNLPMQPQFMQPVVSQPLFATAPPAGTGNAMLDNLQQREAAQAYLRDQKAQFIERIKRKTEQDALETESQRIHTQTSLEQDLALKDALNADVTHKRVDNGNERKDKQLFQQEEIKRGALFVNVHNEIKRQEQQADAMQEQLNQMQQQIQSQENQAFTR